jgi:hypothetical protein
MTLLSIVVTCQFCADGLEAFCSMAAQGGGRTSEDGSHWFEGNQPIRILLS